VNVVRNFYALVMLLIDVVLKIVVAKNANIVNIVIVKKLPLPIPLFLGENYEHE
jgi:hypothetical protein